MRIPRRRPSERLPAGQSLVELVLTVGLSITLAGIAVPAALAGLDHVRTAGAAHYLAGRFALVRMEAVKRSRAVGIRFERTSAGYRYAVYVDGDGDGIRTADIRRGADTPLGGAETLGDRFPDVRFGLIAGVPEIGSSGATSGDDPLRLGRSDILTFTPFGTATPGTVYLRGRGPRQFAVRILGATGRTRVMEYSFGSRTWRTR